VERDGGKKLGTGNGGKRGREKEGGGENKCKEAKVK